MKTEDEDERPVTSKVWLSFMIYLSDRLIYIFYTNSIDMKSVDTTQ